MTIADPVSREISRYSTILGHLASSTIDFMEGLKNFSAQYKLKHSVNDLEKIAHELSQYQITLFNQYKQCISDARRGEKGVDLHERKTTGIDQLQTETIQNIFLHMKTVFAAYSSLSNKINRKMLTVRKYH